MWHFTSTRCRESILHVPSNKEQICTNDLSQLIFVLFTTLTHEKSIIHHAHLKNCCCCCCCCPVASVVSDS